MNFKKGDKVVVIAGKSKGKQGTILKVLRDENKVLVEGANMVKKHLKPNGEGNGSIIEVEAPIHASNVMILDPKTKKPTRIGHTTNKAGKKVRFAKKSNENLD
ncbi:MAG: 50S ribosomal protein L24 [Firmicutes bacterium]|nr:50S ribosomal protein L24 [Bacillota bacterium]